MGVPLAAAISLVMLSSAQAANSTADVEQLGNNNEATVTQAAGGDLKAAAIEQDGDNNFAVAYQEGSEYTLESTQVGSSNVSFAIQEGFRSTATMSQDGVGNRQNVLQQSVEGSLLAEVT